MKWIAGIFGFFVGWAAWALICKFVYGAPPPMGDPVFKLVFVLGFVIAMLSGAVAFMKAERSE